MVGSNKQVIRCGKYKLQLGVKTYIMGILNITPDSFSDGGDHYSIEEAIKHAKYMVSQGADIIDVGGESTRPGAEEVTLDVELKRVVPIVKELAKQTDVPISVDTYKAKVAEETLQAGAHIINDVWGLQKDPEMAPVLAQYNAPIVMMHNQKGTSYDGDIIESIKEFLRNSIEIALAAGVEKEKIILDPGIGFGKTAEQNIEVLGRLSELRELGYPVLLGTSRKSMLGKILDLPPKQRVEGTLATSVLGVSQGVEIIRVHDIEANLRAIKVTDAIVRR
ncbi:dihydropteroate synthase [Proteinivorax tanatarense]|uniref:Dihydropteroate synthase n=1 Tax=Proteinivorax tanatarense TaxID=1260629 RepID=A0AAU7VJT8_9FIRM